MKKVFKILLGFLGFLVLAVVLVLGYLGYIPFLAHLLGSDQPRDLGIEYTEADLRSVRQKSQINYQFGALPADVPAEQSVVYSGSREVKAEFTSQELTAYMNNQSYKYWPFQQVQVKFNADGSGEISGVLDKAKVRGFAAAIDFPSEVADRAMDFLPPEPVFYVKGQAALKNNQVAIFEPQEFEIGRIPMPVNMFLSLVPEDFLATAYAAEVTEIGAELDKVDNKREWIIGYINRRLSSITGLYAKEARFQDDALYYDGTLSAEIKTAQ